MQINAEEVLAYYKQTEFQHEKASHKKWLKEELADGPKKVTDVMEGALKQGISKKQLKNLRKGMGIKSNKTSFKGGFELSLPDLDNND